MIYPRGAAISINLRTLLPEECVAIATNRDTSLVAVITKGSLFVLQAESHLVLACLSRPDADVQSRGANQALSWRFDSQAICVTTTNKALLIYDVGLSLQDSVYNLRDIDVSLARGAPELHRDDNRPRVKISLHAVVRMSMPARCTIQLGDDILACVGGGWLHRIGWSGTTHPDHDTHLSSLPFTHSLDVQERSSRAEYTSQNVCVVDCAYSPLLGGIAAVLSTGRAVLFNVSREKQQGNVWAHGLVDATTVDINHRHRLAIFGCKNADITCYHIDEQQLAFVCLYRIRPQWLDAPDVVAALGAVRRIKCDPSGYTFAVSWQKRGAALFTTYGAQLWHSNGEVSWQSMDWAADGHQLWFVDTNGKINVHTTVRTASHSNASMSSHETLCLYGAERVYIAPQRRLEKSATAPHTVWRIIRVPHSYLSHAWPLRYCTFNSEGTRLVVAGTRGFAVYNAVHGKWALFGNENHVEICPNLYHDISYSQERSMAVSGGIALWRSSTVIATVYDFVKEKMQLRLYSLTRTLSNDFAAIVPLDANVLLLCLRGDTACMFDVQCRVRVYAIEPCNQTENDLPSVTQVAEIRCGGLMPHPICVTGLMLTNMQHYTPVPTPSARTAFAGNADSLLLNVSGRLMLLTPAHTSASQSEDNDEMRMYELQPPLVIMSCVEQMWHVKATNGNSQPHLTQALWLALGSRGVRVWMPLFPDAAARSPDSLNTSMSSLRDAEPSRAQFISKRIMLPFELNSYPLLMCPKECVAIAIDTEVDVTQQQPQRKTELYLHHLLRQLLKRNLGLYALQIANTCRQLPYFAHVLELLLHQILEEEATSSEPIPDPLLPRVVAFINEFPEYLQTVAHCARKTELALWRQLFSCVGSPRELFEICLRDGKLQTAASYLIILQNMEVSDHSHQQASRLLESALHAKEWSIAADICRFVRAIDPAELHSPVTTPALKQAMQHAAVAKHASAASMSDDAAAHFVYPHLPHMGRQRMSSTSNSIMPLSPVPTDTSNSRRASLATKEHRQIAKVTSVDSAMSRSNTPPIDSVPNELQLHLMAILTKHARCLLECSRLRDLGRMAAALDYHLVLWLKRERKRAAGIKDAVKSLQQVHADFGWPYPLLSHAVVESLSRRLQSSTNLRQSSTASSVTSNSSTVQNSYTSKPTPRPSQLTVITASADEKLTNSTRDSGIGTTDETIRLLVQQQHKLSADRAKHLQLNATDDEQTDEVVQLRKPVQQSPEVASISSENALPTSDEEYDWMYPHYEQSTTTVKKNDSKALAKSTPQKESNSAVQLRYLQQIMLEAECIEWSLILCVVLRDIVGLSRALRQCDGTSAEDEHQRLRLLAIVRQLMKWAAEHCSGYNLTLNTMYENILRLHKNVRGEPNGVDSHEDSPSKEPSEERPIEGVEMLRTSISEADLREKSLERAPSHASVAVDVVNGEREENSACSLM